MKQIAAILGAKGRIALHTIASVRKESKLKIAVISVAAVLLWFGVFFAGLGGFRWILQYGGSFGGADISNIGEIVMVRLLSVFALALFFMLISSNILIAFSTLYRSREVVYLVQSPISFEHFFLARFVECVSFSSWASAFLGTPLLLAYGLSVEASPGFYFASLVFYLPFVVLPAAIGSLITLVLARVFPSLPKGVLITISAVAIVFFFFFLRARLNATGLSEDMVFQTTFRAMERTQSPWLPSFWVAQGILAAANSDYTTTVFNWLLITSNAIFAVWFTSMAARALFYPGWSLLFGLDRTRLKPLGKGLLGRLDGFLKPLREPHRALVVKDLKIFWRDATQWSQFVIFFGLMAIYIATLRNDPDRYAMDAGLWRGRIAALNSATCMLILSTLTSRFVFPLISLEGRRFWILGLAPLTYKQLIWQKFWLSFVSTSLFTLGLVVLSCWRLGVEPVAFFLAIYSVLAANFGLAGLAVGLGALYPNFQEDNPARIVSGMGGTLNFLLSMGYITLIALAQAVINLWSIVELFMTEASYYNWVVMCVLFITALSAVCTALPMYLGYRNLQNSEF
jgi:ABC-2 type transport system permease protein